MATRFNALTAILGAFLTIQIPTDAAGEIPSRCKASRQSMLKVFAKVGLGGTSDGRIGPLGASGRTQLVIHSAKDLAANAAPKKAKDPAFQKEVEAQLAKLLKVDAIDWDKQMVVAIWGGAARVHHQEIAFHSFTVKGNALTVTWNETGSWLPGCTRARGVALVERFNGPVLFNPSAQK